MGRPPTVTRTDTAFLLWMGAIFFVGAVFPVLVCPFRARVSYVLMVPTTACLNAIALPQVGQLGEQRVVDNLVGGAPARIASALSIGYARWEAPRANSTTTQDVIVGRPVAAPG